MNRRSFLLGAGVAAATVATGCASAQDYTPRDAPSTPRSSTMGFSTGSSVLYASQADLDRTMDSVAATGVGMVRIDVSWTFAQPLPTYYDWAPSDRVIAAAQARGLTVLATVTNTPQWAGLDGDAVHTVAPKDPSAFGKFAGEVAQRYRGQVAAYEIWNEPNGRPYFEPDPDPIRYTAMLRSAYQAVKAADPAALVVAGALGNTQTVDGLIDANEFVDAMYAAGAQGSFDALSYHPYDFGLAIGDATLYPNSPMQQMISMHATMSDNGDGDKKIWITEYGAPTRVQNPGVTLAQQADLIVDSAQQWTEVSFAGPFFVYTVRDAKSGSPNIEDNYGVLYDSFAPKPAYDQFQALVRSGNPTRRSAADFDSRASSDLGASLSPVFTIGAGMSRIYEQGSLFRSDRGWFVSPPEIANYARSAGVIPVSSFDNGFQDFSGSSRVRVFSDPRFGTHALIGAILDAWRPELGFPLTDEYSGPDGFRVVDFENGRIQWTTSSGAIVESNN